MPKIIAMLRGVPATAINSMSPSNPSLGSWALCVIETPNHAPLASDPDILALPDLTMDAALSNIPVVDRTALIDRLATYGVDTSTMNGKTSFRQVLRALGVIHAPSFDENNFDATIG